MNGLRQNEVIYFRTNSNTPPGFIENRTTFLLVKTNGGLSRYGPWRLQNRIYTDEQQSKEKMILVSKTNPQQSMQFLSCDDLNEFASGYWKDNLTYYDEMTNISNTNMWVYNTMPCVRMI